MPLHEKIHSGRCCDVEWPIREGVVQDCGSPGLEQRRVRIGSGGEGGNRRYGTAVNSERLQFVWPCGNQIRRNRSNRDGPVARIGKSPTFGCFRLVGATPCSFREKIEFPKCQRCTNQVSWHIQRCPVLHHVAFWPFLGSLFFLDVFTPQ